MTNKFFFFAGGEYREAENNAFTTNFIGYFRDILDDRFSIIQGIYHPRPLANVMWALNHARQPAKFPEKNRIITASLHQILGDPATNGARVSLVSSSYGSVVAAQTACYLAETQLRDKLLSFPFNLALGASMVSKQSDLYRKLSYYQEIGIIGTIIYDELQDAGDNSMGIGSTTRWDAYTRALGICFPFLTTRYSGPSFLNQHPVTGHIHRVRSKSEQKAKDFLQTILIDFALGGEEVKRLAERIVAP